MKRRLHRIRGLSPLIYCLLLAGCASSHFPQQSGAITEPNWLSSVIDYKNTLPQEHPDSLDSIYAISSDMRETVRRKFAHLPKHTAAERLARWLIDEDGLGMTYDLSANYSPIEAYRERRGNCLSYTMLLNTLAAELNINLVYNDVKIPAVWDMSSDNEMTLYRHINSLYRHVKRQSVFDLAIEEFNFGYPSRIISRDLAAAMLHSNRAIDHLNEGRSTAALHSISLAISTAPDEGAFWANLGVIYKRSGYLARAEHAFIQALRVDRRNTLAASNLESLYRVLGKHDEARKYLSQAKRSHRSNPYYHFEQAKRYYKLNDLSAARKSVNMAKRLHQTDPRFFELSSIISQRLRRYSAAMRDLRKAHQLAIDEATRGRYAYKAEMVSRLVNERFNKRETRRNFPVFYNVDGS